MDTKIQAMIKQTENQISWAKAAYFDAQKRLVQRAETLGKEISDPAGVMYAVHDMQEAYDRLRALNERLEMLKKLIEK